MLSISSLLNLLLSLVMMMLLVCPVDLCFADTFSTPFASMSKVTSILGTLLGSGGMPVSVNSPSRLLSLVLALSPSYTGNFTSIWLSYRVVKFYAC